MARINTRIITGEFNQLVAASNAMNETKDCSVKAVALACGVEYEVAHRELASNGRVNGRGAYTNQILKAIAGLGFKAEHQNHWNFIDKYPKGHRDVLRNVTTHHPARFNNVWADGNTYVMFTKGHVLTIINGVNHDWTNGRPVRATSIYKITKEVN
jgi:hypothetical protein